MVTLNKVITLIVWGEPLKPVVHKFLCSEFGQEFVVRQVSNQAELFEILNTSLAPLAVLLYEKIPAQPTIPEIIQRLRGIQPLACIWVVANSEITLKDYRSLNLTCDTLEINRPVMLSGIMDESGFETFLSTLRYQINVQGCQLTLL